MTTSTDRGHVYLLGAGFSKAISDQMPVMWELAAQVLDVLERDPAILRPFDGNLESWLSYLATPQPWLSESENLRNRAEYFDVSNAIFSVINHSEQASLREPAPIWLQRLAWQLSDEAADVLTFNYDLLFERAVTMLRRANAFSHLYVAPLTQRMRPGTGIMLSRSEAPGNRVFLYKLHGSTNWYGGPPGADSVPVCVVRDNGPWATDDKPFVPADRYADLQPMIIPPVAVKTPFYGSQALRAGWIRAAQALRAAEHLTIIGYSLPVTDYATAALMALNLAPTARVTVVDLNSATADRVKALLPNHDVKSFVGVDAVYDYVDAHCPQHVEWGVDVLADGTYVPNVLINGAAVEREQLPDPDELTGPDNWNPELLFARWVGTTWPDVTAQGLPSERWRHPGGCGFASA